MNFRLVPIIRNVECMLKDLRKADSIKKFPQLLQDKVFQINEQWLSNLCGVKVRYHHSSKYIA